MDIIGLHGERGGVFHLLLLLYSTLFFPESFGLLSSVVFFILYTIHFIELSYTQVRCTLFCGKIHWIRNKIRFVRWSDFVAFFLSYREIPYMLRHEIGYSHLTRVFLRLITRWTMTSKMIRPINVIYTLWCKYNWNLRHVEVRNDSLPNDSEQVPYAFRHVMRKNCVIS